MFRSYCWKNSAFIVLGFFGSLLFTACGSGGSSPSAPTPPATFNLAISPGTLTVYDQTTFSVSVSASGNPSGSTPSITLGQLPSGFTSSTTFPLSIPSGGVQITLSADKTVAAGNYTISLSGTAGAATASASLALSVQSGTPPTFSFQDSTSGTPFLSELPVQNGGSGQIAFQSEVYPNGPADYTVQLSLTGLPPGTTATISPQTIVPGLSVTVTIAASASAPITQNAVVTLVGTPLAPVPAASISFLADVTPKPGSLPVNRTDYVSTEGSPYSAVYDPAHNLIFSSNPSWNRVDVISNATHKIIKEIPIRAPRGVDIIQDHSQVWVATGSQQVFSINTTTFAATQYLLPNYTPYSGNNLQYVPWEGTQVICLADGTLFMALQIGSTLSAEYSAAIWNPATNTITGLAAPSGGQFPASWETAMRTGDGKRLYSVGWDSAGESFWYDVMTKTTSPPVKLTGYAQAAAVNFDGSRVVILDPSGLNMYDGNYNLLGPVPGGGDMGIGYNGGLLFSPDNKTLFEESMPLFTPLIFTIDASSLRVQGIAPAMTMAPVWGTIFPPFYIPIPFAVDNTGMLLGVEDFGIAFEDSTFSENFTTVQPGTPTVMNHMSPYAGPLAGGTVSGGFGNGATQTPDVWYGPNRGTASVDSSDTLTITSPPGSAPGPVNVKFLFPDGIQVFNPLFFSYGPAPQYALLSGASPDGGAPGEITGYGLPSDPSGGTLTVGGNTATITTQQSQYLPFIGEPFPSTTLNFTVPAGSPGYADIAVNTPNGNGVLSRAFFYAESVKDYPSNDTFTAILLDRTRQQLYLSAADHVDVFSLTSNQFVTPLTPPAQGAQKQFAGLALTPNGSQLLVADLLDGSVAVVNPDNPSGAYAIPIAAVSTVNGCKTGPMYVAATMNQQAYVVTGALPSGITCGPGGITYQMNLATKAVGLLPNGYCGGGNAQSSLDGSIVVFGKNPAGYGTFCTYNVSQNVFSIGGDYRATAALSGDGNVASAQWILTDSSANIVSWVAQPLVYYPTLASQASPADYPSLLQPPLNDSGSLYYMAAPNSIDIVDVRHGLLRMRFSLAETVTNTASPIAIDSGGQHIYLITDKGLTIIDLGQAPLSIGHLSSNSASPGTQVTVRGSGFSSGLTATVGGQVAAVSVDDENTLTLTIPSGLSPGPQDIVITNSNGTSYTLESGVTVP
jgi:hypothetical protein